MAIVEKILPFWTVLVIIIPSHGLVDNTVFYQLREEVQVGTFIGSLITDAELDVRYTSEVVRNLHFQFLTEPAISIHINYNTGVLETNGRVDRESIPGCAQTEQCEIILDVAIQPIAYFQIFKIKIQILDINDNGPEFDERIYEHSLKESASLSSSFIVPSAYDLDSPRFGVQSYELHSDMNLEPFVLEVTEKQDGSLGLRIRLTQELDRELQDHYTLALWAFDGGSPARSASMGILIEVHDSNDNDPLFEAPQYTVTIEENTPQHATIIQVKAVDPDIGANGRVQYRFSPQTASAYSDVFSINPDSGEIIVTGLVDHETNKLYNLIVIAQDQGPDSQPSDTNVVVHVQDINDNPPSILVNTLSSSGQNQAEISEDADVGTFVAHVTVVDPDSGLNGKYNCSLTDQAFRLQVTEFDTEYQIFTAVKLDHETVPEYRLALVCTDHGSQPQKAIQDIQVQVLDINDNSPQFTQELYTASIIENSFQGSSVLSIYASDSDGGENSRIEYTLSENVDSVFHIEQDTGIISTKDEIDREIVSQYRFSVVATDNGSPSRSSSASVVITVEDVNDERPHFSKRSYVFSVMEEEEPGALVGTVEAKDLDGPDNNEFFFSFTKDSSLIDSFMIDTKSGKILTRQRLDREKQASYQLMVAAKDSKDPLYSSTATVSINIRDKNDNPPIFIFPTTLNNTLYMSNKVPIGYNVTHIKANDVDFGPNGQITYEIQSGNSEGIFSIDRDTGSITSNIRLDSIRYKVFRLQIVAKDQGIPESQFMISNLQLIVNYTIPYKPPGAVSSGILSSQNLLIVISVACGCAVVAVILVVAIVCIHRQDKQARARQYNCRIEAIGRMAAKEVMDKQVDQCHEEMEKKPIDNDFKSLVDDQDTLPLPGLTMMSALHQSGPDSTRHNQFVTKANAVGSLEVSASDSISSQGSDQSNADSGRGASDDGDKKHRLNVSGTVRGNNNYSNDSLYYTSMDSYPLPYPVTADFQNSSGYLDSAGYSGLMPDATGFSSLKAHSAAQSYTSYPNPQFTTFHYQPSPTTAVAESSFSDAPMTTRAGHQGDASTWGGHYGNYHSSNHSLHGTLPPRARDTIPYKNTDAATNNGVLV